MFYSNMHHSPWPITLNSWALQDSHWVRTKVNDPAIFPFPYWQKAGGLGQPGLLACSISHLLNITTLLPQWGSAQITSYPVEGNTQTFFNLINFILFNSTLHNLHNIFPILFHKQTPNPIATQPFCFCSWTFSAFLQINRWYVPDTINT